MSYHSLRSIGQFFRATSKNRRLSHLLKLDPAALLTFANDSDDSNKSDEDLSPASPSLQKELRTFATPEPSVLRETSHRLSMSSLKPAQRCDLDTLAQDIDRRTKQLADLQSVSRGLEQELTLAGVSQAQTQRLAELQQALSTLHSQ